MSGVQINKKKKAIALRLSGKTFNEIMKILGLSSKGTLSFWFKNLTLSSDARMMLEKKKEIASSANFALFNKNRTRNINIENSKIFKDSFLEIGIISKRELLLIGTALYWGEGTTRERTKSYSTASFANSDSNMVKVYMRYLREVLNIPDIQIRAGIHIHENIGAGQAKRFWSSITGLPQERFYTFNQVSGVSKMKRPQNFLPYGTVTIKVNRRQVFYKIKGYIHGITRGYQE